MEKVAIFVDWENFKQDIYAAQKNTGNRLFNFTEPAELKKLLFGFVDEGEKVFRIYFYSSYPFEPGELKKTVLDRKNLTSRQKERFIEYFNRTLPELTKFYEETKSFFDKISCEDYCSLRPGELKFNGLYEDASPIFVQKQVDMLMGLDIAHVSYMKHVDKVIIFSKDTDIRPALDTALMNGIETILANIENSYKIPDSLKKYTVHVRSRSIRQIFCPNEKVCKSTPVSKNHKKKKKKTQTVQI